jgi:hypothetical protein
MISRGIDVRLEFEPRSWLLGVTWERVIGELHVYVCPVPTLLLHVTLAL